MDSESTVLTSTLWCLNAEIGTESCLGLASQNSIFKSWRCPFEFTQCTWSRVVQAVRVKTPIWKTANQKLVGAERIRRDYTCSIPLSPYNPRSSSQENFRSSPITKGLYSLKGKWEPSLRFKAKGTLGLLWGWQGVLMVSQSPKLG